MRETTPNLSVTEKSIKRIRNTLAIATVLTLTNCSTPEEKYEKQLQKVQQLEYKLKQLQKNYYDVSTQREIQEDLKKNWADSSIDQEIWYSIERTEEQEKKIEETKEDLAEAQKKLASMKEEAEISRIKASTKKPDPHKYDYIPKEFERSRESQQNNK